MRWQLGAAFLSFAALAFGQRPPEPKLPDTYAANELRSWLRAFNSGDRKAIRDFRLTHYEKADVTTAELDADVAIRAFQRGGAYDLRAVSNIRRKMRSWWWSNPARPSWRWMT